MNKLTKIKEFNSENLTDEFLFKLTALCGKSSFYLQEKFKSKGLLVTDLFCGKRDGTTWFSHRWQNPDCSENNLVRTQYCVRVTFGYDEKLTLYLYSDGDVWLSHVRLKGDVTSWSSDSGYEYATKTSVSTYHPNPYKVIELYLEYGFYSLTNKDLEISK